MDLNARCDKFTTKIKIKDNSYYLQIIWKQNENDVFQIKIFDGVCSWSGRFSNAFAEEFRKHLRKSLVEYCSEVRRRLEEQNCDYIYEFLKVQDEIDSATFKCSKSFDDILVPYFSVPLIRDDVTEPTNSLIDFLLSENKNLKNTVQVYNHKTEDLKSELEKCKSEMEKFVNLKTSLEKSLYGRFVQLLNEKKKRIILLEESLQKTMHT